MCCKTKKLRSLVQGIVWGFEWVKIMGLKKTVGSAILQSEILILTAVCLTNDWFGDSFLFSFSISLPTINHKSTYTEFTNPASANPDCKNPDSTNPDSTKP